jgi:hypothetical protein
MSATAIAAHSTMLAAAIAHTNRRDAGASRSRTRAITAAPSERPGSRVIIERATESIARSRSL